MAIVYQHRRLDNNQVFYIGIGSRADRPTSKRSRSDWWKSVVDKAGYTVEIVMDGISREKAKFIEKGLIALYGRADLGLGSLVNMTDGGDGLANITAETRKKMGAKNIGKAAWNKGIAWSEEAKLKISKAKTKFKVEQYDKNMVLLSTYNSVAEAVNNVPNSDNQGISKSANKIRKTHAGYIWRYLYDCESP